MLKEYFMKMKKHEFYLVKWNNYTYFALAKKKGSLAEWLGTGLQNRLRRFESARNLPQEKLRN